MNRQFLYIMTAAIVLLSPFMTAAQDPTPTPTLVAFDYRCYGGVDEDESFLVNGDFEFEDAIGNPPSGWGDVASGLSGVLSQQFLNAVRQQFVILKDGSSIAQRPQPNLEADQYSTNFYRLRFCAVVEGGVLTVEFAGTVITLDGSSSTVNQRYESEDIRADLSEAGNTPPVSFTFSGDGSAIIDNVELLGFARIGGDETPEPSASPEMPTPTETPTPGPSATPLPTLQAGVPTRTPTPKLSANSVQVIADPPMLVLSPDDFITGSDTKKQILLDVRVIGSNGEVIDVPDIDEDATIQFTIDTRGEAANAGTLLERSENGNETTFQSQRRPMNDVEQVIFVPGKAFDGTVRVIVDIEYDAMVDESEERQEIRGVVPIVFRTNRSASLTGAVGTFNLRDAMNSGRKAGDRGFRPDQKTNLFFREVFQ